VAFSKAFASLARSNPELRFRIDTESGDLTEVHHATTSEWGENGVVKGGTLPCIGTHDGQVIKHQFILAAHTDSR
jgi:hypothetical protein